MIYGYARISTDGQSLDAQVAQLRAAGADKVFQETASGARSDRPQLRRVIGRLAAGDVVMVSRLDRLARSTRDQDRPSHLIGRKTANWRNKGWTRSGFTVARCLRHG